MRTPVFLVGVALALVAFIAMLALGVIFVNRSSGGRQTAVVIAAQDIQARQPITADMLSISQVPASALPPKAFLTVADLTGYSAAVPIYKGQVITANVVANNPDELTNASAYLPIPQGYIAMTLPTSEQQGVAGYIAQGDYIDVIASINSGIFNPANPRTVIRTVFPSLHVIRVGPPSTAPKQGQPQGVASSLTVVMTLCDAQYMSWLLLNATLKYALLAYPDYAKTTAAATPPACLSTQVPPIVGPRQVDARWAFTSG